MHGNFYLYYADFKTSVTGKICVRLFGRTKRNKNVCVIDYNYKPYFWVLCSKPREIVEKAVKTGLCSENVLSVCEKKFLGKKVNVVRVEVENFEGLKKVSATFKKFSGVISVNEVSIPLVSKYLIDKKIMPTGLVSFEGVEVSDSDLNVDSVFNASKVVGLSDVSDDFSVASFDIETFSENRISYDDPIILISLVSKDFKKSYSWKKTSRKSVVVFNSEMDMIKGFFDDLKKVNPDILIAYNSNGFDFPFLKERARKFGLSTGFSKDGSPIKISRASRGFLHEFSGINHIDLYSFMSNIYGRTLKSNSLKLSSVAQELVGDSKKEFGTPPSLWRENKINQLASYCEHDAFLVLKIFDVVKSLIFELSRLTFVQPGRVCVSGFSSLVENHLISKRNYFNEIAPNKPSVSVKKDRYVNRLEGAYVHQPTPGIYSDIVQFDFRSMYPSIISSHNIGPDTFVNNSFSKKIRGLIPSSVKEIIDKRVIVKSQCKKAKGANLVLLRAKEQALKVLANSTFGYLAFDNARWYCFKCASEVTRLGREYIKNTIYECEKNGFSVIYGDTDSVFLKLGDKSLAQVKSFISKINSNFPEGLVLNLEDYYSKGVFVKKKESGSAAKKKYALATKKGELIVKGFAFVRKDWSPIARETQMEVFKQILIKGNIKNAVNVVSKSVKKLVGGKCSIDELIISTRLKKNVDDYKSKSPHVRAALHLKNNGLNASKGTVINYIILKGKGSIGERAWPVELLKNGFEYDVDYYVNNQVIPVVIEILDVAGVDRLDFIKKEQSILSDFSGNN
ncbi:MAG: hypothetical protein GON13_00820 [Nanoarchaeota archaeon]|nr:hypothetical protein [Nanoarchaeota archaeon]